MTMSHLSKREPSINGEMQDHVKSLGHLLAYAAYADCLTATMGVLGGGRAARHMTKSNVSVHTSRPAGDVVPSRAREGAPYPTRSDIKRNFGEARGLAALLMRHFEENRAGYLDERDGGRFVHVKASEIDHIEAGTVYFGMDTQTMRYQYDDAIFLRWDEMLPTAELYYRYVVGRYPSPTLPDPAEVLDDYVRYEIDALEDPPPGYVMLEERQKSWPEEELAKAWPTAVNIEAIKRQPPARAKRAWYVLLQVFPKKETVLYTRLAGRVMGFCKIQIAVPDKWHYVTAWLNEVAAIKATEGFRSLVEVVQKEREEEKRREKGGKEKGAWVAKNA